MSGQNERPAAQRAPTDDRREGWVEPGKRAGSEPGASATNTIFGQPWWLDAVAPGRWGESLVTRGTDVAARLPFAIKERFGVRVLTQPPLAPFLGPWVRWTGSKSPKQLEEEKALMSELIDQLPRFDAFRQSFAPTVGNWLPFYWKGFEATTRYTYRIEDLSDLDRVWGEFAHGTRRHVRKAQKELSVRTDLGIDVLLALYQQVYDKQGLSPPVGADLVHRLDQACADRGARTLLFAVDAQERVHGAALIVHESEQSYLLMSGMDTQLRSSGAISLLVYEAIRRSAEVSGAFDFAGSMIESVERFNRGFGARQQPYLHVRRTRRLIQPLLAARDELPGLAVAVRKRSSKLVARSSRRAAPPAQRGLPVPER
jgi:hypothetical protein